jgi:transmembrane sensor
MTPEPNPPDAALEDAAIAWLAERDDGFSPAREREYAQWLRADPLHAAAVARLEQTLGLLHELPEFRAELNTAFDRGAPVVPFAPAADAPSRRVRRRTGRGLAWSGIAAAITLAGLIAWHWLPYSTENYYATTVAGYQRARLGDGSTIELNAASALRVQFTAAERHVNLEAGEAHFAVAHDAARPFVVRAGGVFVRAVGTAFNVRIASDGTVEVIVAEGKVRVGQGRSDTATATDAPIVAAGERLVLPRQVPLPVVEKVPPAALRTALAWQGRLVEFADAPLSEVVARFNARNQVQLVVADAELGHRRIGGTFAIDEAEAFVRLLELDGEIVAEPHGVGEIRLRRAR